MAEILKRERKKDGTEIILFRRSDGKEIEVVSRPMKQKEIDEEFNGKVTMTGLNSLEMPKAFSRLNSKKSKTDTEEKQDSAKEE